MKIKLKRIAVLITALTLTIVLTLGVLLIPSNFPSIDTQASMAISLFDLTGNMQRGVAQAVLDALGETPKDSSTLDRVTRFRLFPNLSLSSVYAENLSRLNWRITNVDGNRVTFWASEPHRASVFTTTLSEIRYSHGIIRQRLIADYTYLAARMSRLNNHILRQGTIGANAVAADRLWLPSMAEVENGGAWGFSMNTERARFSLGAIADLHINVVAYNDWLRDTIIEPCQSINAQVVRNNGSITSLRYCSSMDFRPLFLLIYATVRPALHISLSSLQAAASGNVGGGDTNPPPDDNNSSNNSGNNDYAANNLIWALLIGLTGGVIVIILLFGITNKILNNKGEEIE